MFYVLALAAAITILYGVLVATYRVLLSPLSNVPGPRLAAITQGYEMIAPNEVHINDPPYVETHFSTSSTLKLNKYAPHKDQFGMPESTFSTIDADLHETRRGALAPFFSRRSISSLEPTLVEKVTKTCNRLEEFKRNKTPVDLRLLFSCLTTDIITEYAFPHCFNLLSTPDLAPAWRDTFAEGLRNFQWFKHFPSLWNLLRSIPDSVLLKMAPQMAITQEWERGNQKLVQEIVDSFDPAKKSNSNITIFHELLSSDLPQHEKSYERLWQEGSALIGAGVETTSNTLCVALYYLSLHPEIRSKLEVELKQAMPTPDHLAPWAKLETLPYLSAVIKEALRLAYGTTSRFIRVAPQASLKYDRYTFPPGTAVSMSAMLLCEHPSIFKEPKLFRPERWLEEDGSSDLLVFGRGTRMCAGQNLAYAELYLTFAAIVRKFELALYDTDFSDIEAVCDATMPMPKADTKGVRVFVS
ncbi:cytochrome P450 [Lophiostoma macrostomum CBS 122681]|uniref:Cytochrome P450 n=1 Tax=Lophiostoma macrostomum CBS 122681 TaxID=1314788 RepID=A0A6A6T1P0_9PLEO|nr:cytochrome P450 [Lophiostoma macrostomum CBS 122681]